MHPLFHPLYIEYCTYFNGNRDYFECHEVLEKYWKDVAPGEKSHPLVGYIQVATGMYHWRRGNLRGAARMLSNGRRILSSTSQVEYIEKINCAQLVKDIDSVLTKIRNEQPFEVYSIEILDDELQRLVAKNIATLPPSDIQYIVNKHILRDRSDILEARAQSIATKLANKSS